MTITEARIELPRAINKARDAWDESGSDDIALFNAILLPFRELLERLDREAQLPPEE